MRMCNIAGPKACINLSPPVFFPYSSVGKYTSICRVNHTSDHGPRLLSQDGGGKHPKIRYAGRESRGRLSPTEEKSKGNSRIPPTQIIHRSSRSSNPHQTTLISHIPQGPSIFINHFLERTTSITLLSPVLYVHGITYLNILSVPLTILHFVHP